MTVTNCARIDRRELPALLLAMENDTGTEITWYAMWIMARTFLRTTELREAPWVELQLAHMPRNKVSGFRSSARHNAG